jgi:hypothetical protein
MKKVIIALAALAVTGAAVAGPEWTNADIGYMRASSDGNSNDTEAFRLRGSLEFADKWHVRAAFDDGEINGGKGSSGGEDFDSWEIFFGVHPALTDSTDLVVELSLFDGENDSGPSNQDEFDGYGLFTGVRTMWSERLELNAGVKVDSGNFGQKGSSSPDQDFTEVSVHAGGIYGWTDNIGVGLDLANGGSIDGNTATFFLRWNFGGGAASSSESGSWSF